MNATYLVSCLLRLLLDVFATYLCNCDQHISGKTNYAKAYVRKLILNTAFCRKTDLPFAKSSVR